MKQNVHIDSKVRCLQLFKKMKLSHLWLSSASINLHMTGWSLRNADVHQLWNCRM